MRFDVLTLFPEMIDYVTGQSIIGRAKEKGIITVNAVDIRDFSQYKSKKVDDYPYGGGSGMVIMANPVYDAYRSLTKDLKEKPPVVYLTPQGKPLTQQKVISLSELDRIILLCGHYEGIDERVIEEIVDDEISIGDYVVTGGELPALILIDAVSRMLPGVLSGEESFMMESHYDGLLEYPQYTRPPVFMDKGVPEVLLSGNHKNIAQWRHEMSVKRTRQKRPDMDKNDNK